MSKTPQIIYICIHPLNDGDAWQTADKAQAMGLFKDELADGSGARMLTWEPDGVTRDITNYMTELCAVRFYLATDLPMDMCPAWVRNTAYGLSIDEGIPYGAAKAIEAGTHTVAWSGDAIFEKVEK